jgi:uncharacterized membrane protein SpoIIM required for sporulation/ABC-type transport system involved in multi-copper enzyme maturation permease subunit
MLSDALILTRREVRDSVRDWRILLPILLLTLAFPWIMNLSTRVALNFVAQYEAQIIPLRLVPFGMMIVGFFPISFSLIIALETFVGEKERNSLEPLLTTPLSDESLYFGKLFAAVLPPLSASFLGIAAYLIMLHFSLQYTPEPIVLLQILLLTTMEAVVMVSGAVVVSSHTTSVRAANLLASFIIVPMAFLIQAETFFLFWGTYDVLWYIIFGLTIIAALFVRTGFRTFNREELLSRELDELNLVGTARAFFKLLQPLSPRRVYREDLPQLIRANGVPIALTTIILLGGMGLGGIMATHYRFPGNAANLFKIDAATFKQRLESPGIDFLPRLDTLSIFEHNAETLALTAVLGLFSFGVIALVLLIAPMAIVGFFAQEATYFGYSPLTFLVAFIAPHGIIELPAAILATAFAVKLGASVIAPPAGISAGENFLRALADLVKIFVYAVLPLLLLAAWIEANITPQIVLYFYGR